MEVKDPKDKDLEDKDLKDKDLKDDARRLAPKSGWVRNPVGSEITVIKSDDELTPAALAGLNRRSGEELQRLADRANSRG